MFVGSSLKSSLKEVSVDNVHIHPKFDVFTIDIDFAMIKLKYPIEFDHTVRPICLPKGIRKDFVGKKLILTGWGNINITDSYYPENLKEVLLTGVSGKKCQSHYHSPITKNMICAYGKGVKDACNGDSGGIINYEF